MLYDPKWGQQTKADPFTLESLIAWLETKDPSESYNYTDTEGSCLWDQYLGRCTKSEEYGKVWRAFSKLGFSAVMTPHTFGAALERARRAISSPQGTKS